MTFDDLLNSAITRPVGVSEGKRLNAQCQLIHTRLLQGRVSNRELSDIALNYTARITELRKAGVKVVCAERNRETGLSYYEIQKDDKYGI